MSERRAQFLEVHLGQVDDGLEVYIVFSENLRVLTQPKPVQPCLDLGHRSSDTATAFLTERSG